MVVLVYGEGEEDGLAGVERYKIEGRVVRPDSSLAAPAEWFANTKVFTNSGHYGFLRCVLLPPSLVGPVDAARVGMIGATRVGHSTATRVGHSTGRPY